MKKLFYLFVIVSFFQLFSSHVFAQVPIGLQSPPQIIDPDPNVNYTQNAITFVITVLAIIGVVGSLIYLVYGGIKWITSGGDKASIEQARQHIVAALVGLIVVIISFVILNIVFSILGIGTFPPQLIIPSLGAGELHPGLGEACTYASGTACPGGGICSGTICM